MDKKNSSVVFKQIADSFGLEKEKETSKLVTKYFKWGIKKQIGSCLGSEREPISAFFPLKHFHVVIRKIMEALRNNTEVSSSIISSLLKELVPGKPFRGKSERYKINMVLGVLELRGFIEWTGKKKPVMYRLKKPLKR
ncbi:hypothetical protein Tpet_1737 [Thermotoga petrophila RKU-1]|jgi:hypothetical protein|uniref:Uncharacterized protein n=1 Tax=Thermotoga petrophila (strain ATCC BAA-488 / DSM 13995 / JCM 10881 / RKU-1) TaxID=390874 RepID=A5ING7_THEP1|nr:hypothetical protein [Thermotoga petrophila]ABQ47740.1 hypothetical protein Tpet_1737 [Thermotoga petrophila RKU-1]